MTSYFCVCISLSLPQPLQWLPLCLPVPSLLSPFIPPVPLSAPPFVPLSPSFPTHPLTPSLPGLPPPLPCPAVSLCPLCASVPLDHSVPFFTPLSVLPSLYSFRCFIPASLSPAPQSLYFFRASVFPSVTLSLPLPLHLSLHPLCSSPSHAWATPPPALSLAANEQRSL